MATTKYIDTLYDLFVNRYMELLSHNTEPANITCAIHIGQVIGTLKGCSLRLINRCNNNTELSFSLMIQALLETIRKLPIHEQERIANEIGIDLHTTSRVSELEQRCSTTVEVSEIIDVQNLNVGSCIAPDGHRVLIQFINTGSAVANCGLNTILQSLTNKYIHIPINNKLSLGTPWIIILSFLLICLMIISICSLKRRIKLAYKYNTILKV
ncbi:S-S bond formation pathway protein [Sea otter poxvirus]|uniref:S-S bond formation pathway protein n=1 Tax=Sea otter poxvirus TaxID=1416741 RepID=A0A2U9QHH7_9POXV|nr:S-S bond formation pathway protein [Sea otter poxvirus]AWU47058.1 S-S bond formation pathway protein [Sea otter poxvirus]